MYTEFFQLGALPANALKGVYDTRLVLLSFLVAMVASYIALDLTGRLRDHNNSTKDSWLWLLGGSVAMGSGIWSMHFIGMLSFTIPGLALNYDLFWTVLSLIVAILASFFALYLLKQSIINMAHLIGGGIILGLAIASMHYTGMTAMLISLNISYLPGLFLISILVAMLASEAAIWFALKSNAVILKLRGRIKTLSAITMGGAICGMHYTGMAASIFKPLCDANGVPLLSEADALNPAVLSIIIAAVTLVLLGIAFFASNYKESQNLLQFEKARELGMAEISASVLHNVGNVLNSINVSMDTLVTSRKDSPIKDISKLAALLSDHKDDLAHFLTQDPRGIHVLGYIEELAKCCEKERRSEAKEMDEIVNNITLINHIISTQQDVIKVDGFEQIIVLNELIDETLLLSGVYQKNTITVVTEYADMSALIIDKIKLFQALDNLISNAKDSLLESKVPEKILKVRTALINKDKIEIEISDNGLGIPKSDLDQIFVFGFTTKKTGHGFGLHSSALSIHDLGGEIKAKSEGLGHGASFTIYLPYRKASVLKKQ